MAVEMAMMVGVILLSFLTDWSYLEETGDAWSLRLLIVLLSFCAVVLQREQQDIKLDEGEE